MTIKRGGISHARIGFGAVHGLAHQTKRDDSTCATGGFYKSPTAGQSVNSTLPFNITWDTTCLSTTAVDIYLYQPGAAQSRIHLWETVDYSLGSYQTTLKPKWWNATSSVSLQLNIVGAGSPPFLSTLPAGPIFTATYTAPTSGGTPADANTAIPDSAVESVNNLPVPHKGPTKGGIAAAVIFPLLIVGGLVYAYLRWSRARGREKRKRWSEAVDKRMSTISTDWKSISAAGAQAAIRHSMAIRPLSTASMGGEGGNAGVGTAGGLYMHDGAQVDEFGVAQMSQLRPGVRTSTITTQRVSRVSFAADPRPSAESRRSMAVGEGSRRSFAGSEFGRRSMAGDGSRRSMAGVSRAFHSSFIPPVPEVPASSSSSSDSGDGEVGLMSPTQKEGALSLSPEDIQARVSVVRPSMDEYLPALSMMRTGVDGPTSDNDYLLSPTTATSPISTAALPVPPTPTHQIPKSPIMGAMPMQPMPAAFMSPDDMLRAYAESRKNGVASPPMGMSMNMGGPSVPAASYNGNGMRVLYTPTPPTPVTPFTPNTATPLMRNDTGSNNPFRKSMAVTISAEGAENGHEEEHEEEDEEDAYVGTAN
ncbi:hypothetical protein JAAARDRAFT_62289 [Jaapia argillacea MUCL 33604]|uniref:Uncharacterized protein n=1 Tax=Jaapia argillacea MUCL 33604 TaxID=933084 RepID=A0A067PN52_9AGAM|nr:hypothetical protein JAAARDRAFT_62289 [Jaapia argillacea MUCL 33604]